MTNCTCHFVVGMSRAGTTWAIKMLNQHPSVAAFGETLYWGRHFVPPGPDGCYSSAEAKEMIGRFKTKRLEPAESGPGCLSDAVRMDLPRLIDESFPTPPDNISPGALFRNLCAVICAAERKTVAVEKTPHHLHWIDRIVTELPDARFIVMVREPYGFVLSYKYQGEQSDQATRILFERSYHPFAAAMVWRSYMRSVRSVRQRYSERVLVVDLKEVKERPVDVLKGMLDFLQVAPFEFDLAEDKYNSSFARMNKPEMAPEDIFWTNLLARKYFADFGVSRRASIASFGDFLAVAFSVIRLPIWAIATYSHYRKRFPYSFWRHLWRMIGRPGEKVV